jgi:tetratricopeptide (TPR) repeat protein
LKNQDSAIENAAKAIQINSKNSNYSLALGRMLQTRNKAGDMDLAEKYFKLAVSLNDKDINSHFYLGLFYEKSKNKESAKSEYRKVIELIEKNEANGETVSQIRKMIANIDQGIENTPQNLGLVEEKKEEAIPVETNAVPASVGPTLEEAQGQ